MPSDPNHPHPEAVAQPGSLREPCADPSAVQGTGQQRPLDREAEDHAGAALPERSTRAALVMELALASREFDATGAEAERNCWLVVHRHVHGVLPSEYDIREIDEDLYLEVLATRRELERSG